MSIDFSGGGLDAEELEPLVTTSLTREDEGVVLFIISPRGNPPHHTGVGYYTTTVARTS